MLVRDLRRHAPQFPCAPHVSHCATDAEAHRHTLDSLAAMGVRMAIDDLGTGYPWLKSTCSQQKRRRLLEPFTIKT